MSSFAFRQRAGHVDWKAITSVKTENIVSKADTKQLQFVLDGATFCEFRPEDVRNNSIESVAKLVNILQFISEYLLHCQEVQFKVIRELQAKADKNHTTIDKLKKENLALKEDRKIYQRQLAMLRKSLGPDYFLNNHNSGEGRQQPVVTNLLKTTDPVPEPRNTEVEVIDSILKHEAETRHFMTSMLNDQRTVFMEQIRSITDSLRASQVPNENAKQENINNQAALLTTKLQSQVESSLKAAVEAMQSTVSQAVQAMSAEQAKTAAAVSALKVAPAAPSSSSNNKAHTDSNTSRVDTQLALQTAALEQFELELNRRQQAIERQERELGVARGTQELTLAARRASDTERLDLLTANESIAMAAFSIAARVVFNTIKHALTRKKRSAWQVWVALMVEQREAENSAGQAKLLVYAKDQRTLRENELQSLLDLEREKTASILAKQDTLMRALSAAESKVSDLTFEAGRNASPEGDLANLLRLEREKCLVVSAKYNTLKSKADREIAQLQERLQSAEDTRLFSRLDQGGNLGDDQPSTAPPSPVPMARIPAAAPTLLLRQSLQRQYIGSAASEADLFSRVQKKLAARKTPEEIEAEAMSQLAQEISERMMQSQQ